VYTWDIQNVSAVPLPELLMIDELVLQKLPRCADS
jgi:hypothetical protein